MKWGGRRSRRAAEPLPLIHPVATDMRRGWPGNGVLNLTRNSGSTGTLSSINGPVQPETAIGGQTAPLVWTRLDGRSRVFATQTVYHRSPAAGQRFYPPTAAARGVLTTDAAGFRRRALAELTRVHQPGGIVLDRGATVHLAMNRAA